MNLKPRIHRLERANTIPPDAWLKSLSDDDLLFLIHHDAQAILADPGIAEKDGAKVAAEIAALAPPPCIDDRRAAVLIGQARQSSESWPSPSRKADAA
jgi:hypothetical protein